MKDFISGLLFPVRWIQQNFYIQAPVDPASGRILPPGPIRLMPHQARLLEAALERAPTGYLRWRTVIWSAPKKTGKTAIAAAVALWYAVHHPDSEVYCLANDGAQARDRVYRAIQASLRLNPIQGAKVYDEYILLPNNTRIVPLPTNATGASGANPGMTVFTEVWAYDTAQKKLLFTEMAASPLVPDSITWIESYAGYRERDSILRELFRRVRGENMDAGNRHEALPDLPVWIEPSSGIFLYYDSGQEARRFPWQTDEYYRNQAAVLSESEFRRIHLNEWIGRTTGEGIPLAWWQQCAGSVPEPGKHEPVVLGVDAAVTGDCFAVVGLRRMPGEEDVYGIVLVRIWKPHGAPLDFSAIERELRDICERYNVAEIAYDPFQLHDMMSRLRREWVAYTREFPQRSLRAVADAALYHAIRDRRIVHPNDPALNEHCANVVLESSGAGGLRFSKRTGNIDGMVALSMALFRAKQLNL